MLINEKTLRKNFKLQVFTKSIKMPESIYETTIDISRLQFLENPEVVLTLRTRSSLLTLKTVFSSPEAMKHSQE